MTGFRRRQAFDLEWSKIETGSPQSKPSVQAVKGGLIPRNYGLQLIFCPLQATNNNMVLRPNGRLQSRTGQKDQIVGLS